MELSAGNLFDIVLAAFFVLVIIRGWYVGLALQVAHLAVLLASAIVAKVFADIAGIPVLAGVVFLIAFVLLWRAVKLVKIVDWIPVVGGLDRLGGAVVGFGLAFLVCLVLFSFLGAALPVKTWNEWGLTREMIDKTYILRVFLQ